MGNNPPHLFSFLATLASPLPSKARFLSLIGPVSGGVEVRVRDKE